MADAAERVEQTFPEMTADEFLDWDGGGHQGKMELVGGQVVAMSPATPTHGIIQANVAIAIGNHLRQTKRPCRVGTETPVVPPIARGRSVRVPDVAVSCAKASNSKVLEDPILIVEVMSPGNEKDTQSSLQAIAGLTSVMEILVVQSTRIEADVYRRAQDGGWAQEPDMSGTALNDVIRLECLELDVPLSDIYWNTYLADEAAGKTAE